jgi:hypothetical protein
MSQIRVDSIVPRVGIVTGATGGGIIQVVRASSNTYNQTPSANSTWTDAGPSVTITPRSTSNLIMIESSVMCIANNNNYVAFKLLRGSTAIREWWGYMNVGSYAPFMGPGKHIDSPATTSAVTYKLQIYATNSYGNFYFNYAGSNNSNSLRNAELYAMELSA